METNRIFITGGASGLGKAIAMFYAKSGAKVAIGDINDISLEETKQELLQHTADVLTFHCDTTKFKDLEKVRSELETQWLGLDILVNNAGIVGQVGEVEELTISQWQHVLEINLLGVIRGCKAFNTLFKQQKNGAIVNIASMAGIINAPQMGIYSCSKAGVISLTETLHYELAPYNVSAHVVCPAFFKTNLTDSMASSDKSISFVNKLMESSTLTADDIAAMIAKQIESRDLFLLPHKRERNLYLLKRLLPNGFFKKMSQMYTKGFSKKVGTK
jgi:short-subunit dehydrogenase